MRALERELGAVLLTRTPQGVALTTVGRAVLVPARQAVAAVRACREAAEGAVARGAHLSVAAGLMATLYVLPAVVERFRELHPEVELDLQPAHHRVAVERLLAHEVDAAVIASPVRSKLVRSTPILHDPLLLVGPPGGDSTPVRLAELGGRPLLVLAVGTGLYEQIEAALRRRGVQCRLVERPTAETIKSAVGLGMGATILPASSVSAELAAGLLSARPFADWPGGARVISLLLRADGRPPRPVAAFAALLRDCYRAPDERA
jgi:LysR family hydrogen peroxide-inducible transcriptional activator